MTKKTNVDDLIREALSEDDAAEFEELGEPGVPETIVDLFRGRLRLYVVLFFLMTLTCTVVSAYCGYRFLMTTDVAAMLRWGAGFFFCAFVAINAKNWYWLQMEHVSTMRALKRLELLLVHLAAERRSMGRA